MVSARDKLLDKVYRSKTCNSYISSFRLRSQKPSHLDARTLEAVFEKSIRKGWGLTSNVKVVTKFCKKRVMSIHQIQVLKHKTKFDKKGK